MASVFTTGTINGTNAADVGLQMAQRIRDDLSAHAAWDLVEEYTPASGQVWYVFKCLASVSGLPADFFLVMGRQISTGFLQFFICELYNSSTHVATAWPVSGGSSTEAFDASGRSQKTYTLSTSTIPGSSAAPVTGQWSPSGTTTKYSIIAHDDQVVLMWNGAANGYFVAGAYTPLTYPTLAMPLLQHGHIFSNGGITRNPVVVSATKPSGALNVDSGAGSSMSSAQMLGFRGDLSQLDALQNNKMPLAELGINITSYGTGFQGVVGWAVGKQKRILVGTNPKSGFAWGDSYSINGTLWVPYQPTDVRVFDTGIPV